MKFAEFMDEETLKEYNLDKNCNREDIIRLIDISFERFNKSYHYETGREIESKSKALPEKFINNKTFMQHIHYGQTLALSYLNDNFNELDTKLKNEITAAEEEGGLCIYVSIVLYCLLIESRLVNIKDIDYMQGYYKHELRKDFPLFIPFGKNHLGLHSFLKVKGSTIDVCIVPQEQMFFDFGDEDIILGNIPDGLELIGFKESFGTVMEYVKKYTEKADLTYNQWIRYHQLNSEIIMLQAAKRYMEEKYSEILDL